MSSELPSEQAMFAKHLFQEGYPLWSPDPSRLPEDREREGIRIGDLGIVDQDGYFYLLFNVRESSQAHPPSSTTVESPLLEESDILSSFRRLPIRSVVASPPTSWTIDPVHRSNARHFKQTLYHTEMAADGTHIILPHGAEKYEVAHQARARFEDLARRHGREWYKLAREKFALKSDPLYLITGFYKTCSWALASFRANGDTGVGVRCTMVERDERQILRDQSLWNPTGRFKHKIGPAPENEGLKNQSVFISGIVITPRQPEPNRKPYSMRLRAFSPLSRVFSRARKRKGTSEPVETDDQEGAVLIDRVPRIQQATPHPGDLINRYLLKKEPSSDFAITDDAKWITLVETRQQGQLSTMEDLERRVEQLLAEHYSVAIENGIVYLKDKESIRHEGPLGHFGLDRFCLPVDGLQSVMQIEEIPFTGGDLTDIYLGTLRTSDKTIKVAVKAFRRHLAHANAFSEIENQAQRSIDIWSTLDHINVLPLIGTIPHNNSPFPAIVTPWIEYGDLSSYLSHSNRRLTDTEMTVLIHDVACGLHYLHSRDIVYGGLTTSNILVGAQGRAFLDFFTLSAISSTASPWGLHTHTSARGAMHWIAPELSQIEQEGVEDPPGLVPTKEADVYAFGGIMLQILVPGYFQSAKVVSAMLLGNIPERPDDPRLTDHRWNFACRCFSPPAMRPSAVEIVMFGKHELPVSPSTQSLGDLNLEDTLGAQGKSLVPREGFRAKEDARDNIFLVNEESKDAEARQQSDALLQQVQERVASTSFMAVPSSSAPGLHQGLTTESIQTVAKDATSWHASDILGTVRTESEEMAREREVREPERARIDGERRLFEELTTKVTALEGEFGTRIAALERELARTKAELDNKRQIHLTQEAETRAATTDLDEALRDQPAEQKTLMDERRAQKQRWEGGRDAQSQKMMSMIPPRAEQATPKHRGEETQANEGKLSIQHVMEALERQYAKQRELLNTLSDSWRADSNRQHEETISAVRATANEQVPYNVQGYLDELSKTLAIEVRMLLSEVGKLREERTKIQYELGDLMIMRSKYGPGGSFGPAWEPPMPPGPPAAPPLPSEGLTLLGEPPQKLPAWRIVDQRSTHRIRKPQEPSLPGAPSEPIPEPRQVHSWVTWQPDPTLAPTPPSAEPTSLVPERGSPGLFGPRSPRGSYHG